MTKKKLRKQFKRFANTSEQPLKLYSGALGIYIGGKQYVDVPNRPGFVYVRLLNDISQLIQAHNQSVSPVYDLPVLVVRANNRYEIYARDTATYGSYWNNTSSYLPRHGGQHEFDPDNNGGGDLVFVHGEQFYPMMTFPSGTDGAGNVLIAPYRYFHNSQWYYTGNTGTPDLLQYRPTGSANAKLILIGITEDTGNPFVKTGVEFSAAITGAAELTSYVPTNITLGEELPGAIVRLVTGTQTITWANIYDARQYMGILAEPSTFLNLSDTPNSYSGQADKLVVVNSAETALEFRANTGSFGVGGAGTGTYFDGIQETFYPTILVSSYTGSFFNDPTPIYTGTYYQFAFVPGSGTQLNSLPITAGNDKPALAWATSLDYDPKEWLLRGEYTLLLQMARQSGSHPMTAYCQLFYAYNGITEQLVATSSLAQNYLGSTSIIDENDGVLSYAFRMRLDSTAYTENGPIQLLGNSSERFVVKVYANASGSGINGYLSAYPDVRDFFNVNLQRQILDNHYFPISGTFLQLSDTPNSYSGQGSKFVAVNGGATGLEFVNAPSGGGGSSVLAQNEGALLGTGTAFNFVGGGVDANISGSVVQIVIPSGPQGFLQNGKISPTVTGGQLTLAIKTLSGDNPSSTNPVFVRIGDSDRSITSALSVSAPTGTNWSNAGSAILATNEIDWFSYLGYNATDGVVLGLSRIPWATQYSNFSVTGTIETFAKISTITNAAANDVYENIGRFAATLSAGASYIWTVPTFTAINLIQRPIYETRWLDYTVSLANGAISAGGGTITSLTSAVTRYQITNRNMNLAIKIAFNDTGTGAGWVNITMPFSPTTGAGVDTGVGHNINTGEILHIEAQTNGIARTQKYNSNFPAANGQTIYGNILTRLI